MCDKENVLFFKKIYFLQYILFAIGFDCCLESMKEKGFK